MTALPRWQEAPNSNPYYEFAKGKIGAGTPCTVIVQRTGAQFFACGMTDNKAADIFACYGIRNNIADMKAVVVEKFDGVWL